MYQIHVNVLHRDELLCLTFSVRADGRDSKAIDKWIVAAMRQLGYRESQYSYEYQISPEDL